MHEDQLSEFRLRSEVQRPVDIIRSATVTAAQLLRMEGQIGVIAAGASADLLAVDADPLRDLGALTDPEHRLKLIMCRGRIVKHDQNH
jgi:imidazolonepropionase-like amidohydrolase